MVHVATKKQKVSNNGESSRLSTTAKTTMRATPTTSRDESTEVKIGVIGCGRIGMLHLEALANAPGITPIICANPTIERAREGMFTVKVVVL